MSDERLLWHYTHGVNFRSILHDCLIKPATDDAAEGERPAVWFSRNEIWEPTANKVFWSPDGTPRISTTEEMLRHGQGLIRIGVKRETAPHNWDEFVRLSGAPERTIRALKSTAKARGSNHKDWFVSFDPVPREKWVVVEEMRGSAWVALTLPSTFSTDI